MDKHHKVSYHSHDSAISMDFLSVWVGRDRFAKHYASRSTGLIDHEEQSPRDGSRRFSLRIQKNCKLVCARRQGATLTEMLRILCHGHVNPVVATAL